MRRETSSLNGDGGEYLSSFELSLDTLCSELDYSFSDVSLLWEALTHSSALKELSWQVGVPTCNERLEFLGDAVLDLIISTRIMELEESYREGDMSKLRASLVCEPQLSQIARNLSLNELIRLGKGERHSDGADKDSILADAVEAIIGAVYLDGGFGSAQQVVNRLYNDIFSEDYMGAITDYKSKLQELTQERFAKLPDYELITQDGPAHNPLFEVAVSVNGGKIGVGKASSKKRASQIAAQQGLEILQSLQGKML